MSTSLFKKILPNLKDLKYLAFMWIAVLGAWAIFKYVPYPYQAAAFGIWSWVFSFSVLCMLFVKNYKYYIEACALNDVLFKLLKENIDYTESALAEKKKSCDDLAGAIEDIQKERFIAGRLYEIDKKTFGGIVETEGVSNAKI